MLTHEVARRLEQKLGLGEFPMVRRRLFSRLQRLCEKVGDAALVIVAGVLDEAHGPKIRDKGHYFAWVVKRRLGEAGLWEGPPAQDAANEPAPQAPKPPAAAPVPTFREMREHLADATREGAL